MLSIITFVWLFIKSYIQYNTDILHLFFMFSFDGIPFHKIFFILIYQYFGEKCPTFCLI